MTKIYNVFMDYQYDGIKYLGSFSTQEQAEEFKSHIHHLWQSDCFIEEFTLNSSQEASENIQMNDNWRSVNG